MVAMLTRELGVRFSDPTELVLLGLNRLHHICVVEVGDVCLLVL